MSQKKYGLILPKKEKCGITETRKLNRAFDSGDELESDEEKEECPLNWIETTLKNSAGNASQKNTQKRLMRDALQEDSTIFQYDEVYNDMKSQQKAIQEVKKQKDKPKYITTILKQAEKRKLNFERLKERKVQREREAEGDEFADKESFVTPSYLKKLEEIKKAEVEELRQRMLEEKNDLHKHKNFGAFYSHLYQQKMGTEIEIKKEPLDEQTLEDGASTSTPADQNSSAPEGHKFKKENQDRKSRQYRRRSSSRSPQRSLDTKEKSSPSPSGKRRRDSSRGSTSDKSNIDRNKRRSSENKNIDADSDFEIDSSPEMKKEKCIKEEENSPQTKTEPRSAQNGDSNVISDETKKMSKEEKMKELFAKRTQGTVFDQAVARYFVRLSQREVMA